MSRLASFFAGNLFQNAVILFGTVFGTMWIVSNQSSASQYSRLLEVEKSTVVLATHFEKMPEAVENISNRVFASREALTFQRLDAAVSELEKIVSSHEEWDKKISASIVKAYTDTHRTACSELAWDARLHFSELPSLGETKLAVAKSFLLGDDPQNYPELFFGSACHHLFIFHPYGENVNISVSGWLNRFKEEPMRAVIRPHVNEYLIDLSE